MSLTSFCTASVVWRLTSLQNWAIPAMSCFTVLVTGAYKFILGIFSCRRFRRSHSDIQARHVVRGLLSETSLSWETQCDKRQSTIKESLFHVLSNCCSTSFIELMLLDLPRLWLNCMAAPMVSSLPLDSRLFSAMRL